LSSLRFSDSSGVSDPWCEKIALAKTIESSGIHGSTESLRERVDRTTAKARRKTREHPVLVTGIAIRNAGGISKTGGDTIQASIGSTPAKTSSRPASIDSTPAKTSSRPASVENAPAKTSIHPASIGGTTGEINPDQRAWQQIARGQTSSTTGTAATIAPPHSRRHYTGTRSDQGNDSGHGEKATIHRDRK
jgi:hypothetical protein